MPTSCKNLSTHQVPRCSLSYVGEALYITPAQLRMELNDMREWWKIAIPLFQYAHAFNGM